MDSEFLIQLKGFPRLTRLDDKVSIIIYIELIEMWAKIHNFPKEEVKCKQPRAGFELGPCQSKKHPHTHTEKYRHIHAHTSVYKHV